MDQIDTHIGCMLENIRDIARYLNDEKAAGEVIEKLRWPEGVVCPLCDHEEVYELQGPNPDRKQWKCARCRKKFSVTSRSIFEGSKIPLGKWIYAIWSMCGSKKGVSANQLKRELGITYKSARFMCHRIREAMAQEPMAEMLGGKGESPIVELDETYVGGKLRNNRHKKKGPNAGKKATVMTLIDREGDVKTVHVPNARKETLQRVAKPIVDQSANIVTDAHLSYTGLDKHFKSHHTVDHGETFVRGVIFHTNFAESYHSLLKRGVIGIFHQVSDKHLHRYLNEFDWRWNTRQSADTDRAKQTISSASGKRLMYRKGANALISAPNSH